MPFISHLNQTDIDRNEMSSKNSNGTMLSLLIYLAYNERTTPKHMFITLRFAYIIFLFALFFIVTYQASDIV